MPGISPPAEFVEARTDRSHQASLLHRLACLVASVSELALALDQQSTMQDPDWRSLPCCVGCATRACEVSLCTGGLLHLPVIDASLHSYTQRI